MIAVIVCNVFSVVVLIGLFAGFVFGFIQAGEAVGSAMAFDPRRGVGVDPPSRGQADGAAGAVAARLTRAAVRRPSGIEAA